MLFSLTVVQVFAGLQTGSVRSNHLLLSLQMRPATDKSACNNNDRFATTNNDNNNNNANTELQHITDLHFNVEITSPQYFVQAPGSQALVLYYAIK